MFDQQFLSFSREMGVAQQERQNQHQLYSHGWILGLDTEFLTLTFHAVPCIFCHRVASAKDE